MEQLPEITPPPCPDCGGDMMGFPDPPGGGFFVWVCRCCGASFAYNEHYDLRPYLLEIL